MGLKYEEQKLPTLRGSIVAHTPLSSADPYQPKILAPKLGWRYRGQPGTQGTAEAPTLSLHTLLKGVLLHSLRPAPGPPPLKPGFPRNTIQGYRGATRPGVLLQVCDNRLKPLWSLTRRTIAH